MGYPVPNIYDYTIVSRIAPRPVTADEMIDWLKLDVSLKVDTDFTDAMDILIDAAVLLGEKLTKRTFRESNFLAYLDYFVGTVPTFSLGYRGVNGYELRSTPLQSITKIEYLKDTVLTEIASSKYYATSAVDFPCIALVDGQSWPTDVDTRLQAITFTYIAGFPEDELPPDLKQALKVNVAAMYVNVGDCEGTASGTFGSCDPACALPAQAKNIYNQNRIFDLRQGL